jgi:hypothetical protein
VPALPRFVFLLDEDADVGLPAQYSSDPNPDYHARQQAFRSRLSERGTVKRVDRRDRLEMLVFQALRDSRDEQKGQPPTTAEIGSGRWAAALVSKDPRIREFELKLSHSEETFTGCAILIDGRKVGDLSTLQSGRKGSLRGERAWRRWVVPVDDGSNRLPLILSGEISMLSNKLISMHVQVGDRGLYAEGRVPPATGWESS